MAWTDRPTDHQIGILANNIEAYLDEELDFAKESGAVQKQEALKTAIDEDIVRKSLRKLAETSSRLSFSKAIKASETTYGIPVAVQRDINTFMRERGVEVDYDRVRNVWKEERQKCQRG